VPSVTGNYVQGRTRVITSKRSGTLYEGRSKPSGSYA
jgi:hypothetical protein